MSEVTKTERRERKDVQRNLERVLQAARELFAEHGANVTMDEVARRAGVGVGTVYRRFPSKDHLWAAVSQAACQHTQHCLTQAAADASDPVGKLRAIVIVHYHQTAQHPALLDLQPAAASEQPGDDEPRLYAALHTLLEEVISEGQRQGTIRAGDPAVFAAICLELLSPRTFQHLQHVVDGPAEVIAEHVVRFVLGGLRATSSVEPVTV